jgi:hypothetical protein
MSGLVCRRNVAGRELIEAMTTRYMAYGLGLRCSFRLPGSIFVLARDPLRPLARNDHRALTAAAEDSI